MQIYLKKIYTAILCCILSIAGHSTTIIPFSNLGEMGNSSDFIVLAKAEKNLLVSQNGIHFHQTRFIVLNSVKGNSGTQFVIQNLSRDYGDLKKRIAGDVDFQEGETYLLFLEEYSPGLYRTKMLSHGVFIQKFRDNEPVLVPVNQGLILNQHVRQDGIEVEPFAVYNRDRLLSHISKVVHMNALWNKNLVSTKYSIASFYADNNKNSPPSHCSFVSSANPPFGRWIDFPGVPLPVNYDSAGDSGCPAVSLVVQNAINNINNNYPGVILTGPASYTGFSPDCEMSPSTVETINDATFINFVNNSLGGSRNVMIIFDDPCNDIPDLSGCSGVLAYGGMYSYSSTHIFNGMAWEQAAYGFVVVNNGVGACYCDSEFDVMLTHEMTHTLGINHIDSFVGPANLNPDCCVNITALDIDCLLYTYPSTTVAVELLNFKAKQINIGVELQWEVTSESQNDYFLIEKSSDGIYFDELGQINTNEINQEINDYTFIDGQPFIDRNYYRLTPIDFNGKLGENRIISIDYNLQKDCQFFPNPTNGDLGELIINANREETWQIQIINMNGQRIQVFKDHIFQKGINRIALNLNGLINGIYFIKLSNQDKQETIRFIKSE